MENQIKCMKYTKTKTVLLWIILIANLLIKAKNLKQLTKEFSYLKEVLQMSKNEDWFKPIYDYLNPTKNK